MHSRNLLTRWDREHLLHAVTSVWCMPWLPGSKVIFWIVYIAITKMHTTYVADRAIWVGRLCRQLLSKFWWRATLHQNSEMKLLTRYSSCSDRPAAYVGQTGQNISKELQYALTSGRHVFSAVVEHIINWRKICILDSHLNLHQRCILES